MQNHRLTTVVKCFVISIIGLFTISYGKSYTTDNYTLGNGFKRIDEYARKTPKEHSKNISALVEYLSKVVESDIEKARVIFSWLAYHIVYDDSAFNSDIHTSSSPEEVLSSSRAFCDGYSGLFEALGGEMGLEVVTISGYAKGYEYNATINQNKVNHAWNAIKIDGKWCLFDATWGSGFGRNVDGKMKSISEFDDTWFDIDPYFAIFSHYPTVQKWTLIDRDINWKQYHQLPDFDSNIIMYIPDFKPLFDYYILHPNVKPPKFLKTNDDVKILNYPKSFYLDINQKYNFKIYAPEIRKLGVIETGNNWSFFSQKNGYIIATIIPKTRGKLSITIQDRYNNEKYNGLLEHKVR